MSAISLSAVWKSYPLWSERERTIRGTLVERLPALTRRRARRWVLRDVSVEVPRGQSLGVIGRNGAGKSTLLRVVAGVTRADRGSVGAPDGLAAVLSLAETFDPRLSGRENAYTAALLAGRSRADAAAMVPAALEFAGLGEHAAAPVRSYSDGMRLRLAFGVVSCRRPTALVIDEVITVGDLAFQAKCLAWVREQRAQGTPLLLASHDLRLVERECDRAIWLEAGRVNAQGSAAEVVAVYERAQRERAIESTPESAEEEVPGLRLGDNRVGTQEARIEAVYWRRGQRDVVLAPGGAARIQPGDRLDLALEVRGERKLSDPIVAFKVHREGDDFPCVDVNTRDDGISLGSFDSARIMLAIERLDLAPGRYLLDFGLYSGDWETVFDFHHHAVALEVGNVPVSGAAPIFPPRRWELG